VKRETAALLTLCALAAGVRAETGEAVGVATPGVPASVLTEAKRESAAGTTTPQTLQVIPGVNEIIPVAVGHLNRIVTPFDSPQVRTVSQATTQIEGNVLYVATPDETPVTLYITPGATEEVALSLTLAPRRIPPREIRLTLDAADYKKLGALQGQSNGQNGKFGNASQDYIAQLKTTFRALALMRTPKGYALREPAAGESIRCTQAGLYTRTGQALEGRDMVLLVGVARNTGATALEIDERSCTNDGEVLAIAAWPKVLLEPGEATELYVAVRRPRDEDTTARPSLLSGAHR
jgi:conjugal transfer pilus assembly protein TraK